MAKKTLQVVFDAKPLRGALHLPQCLIEPMVGKNHIQGSGQLASVTAMDTTSAQRDRSLRPMKVIRVSHIEPNPVGHGGKHRAYQIQHDLELTVGKDNVVEIGPSWVRTSRISNALLRVVREIRQELVAYTENPLRLLARTQPMHLSYHRLPVHYERIVKGIAPPLVCIIEHPGLGHLLQINLRYGIPTIICSHNLEAFDRNITYNRHKWGIYAKAIDFANEFRVLAECDERLLISKVEAGLTGGLGLSSHYYPYLPVGTIRKHCEQVRQERSRGRIEPGLFLMLGTFGHETTRESFAWFIRNAQTHGLPRGVEVIVGGRGTKKLLPAGISVPGLELRGWLEQDELNRLLVQAKAVLAPQNLGFGTLTRLPEMSCAGVPVIVSKHATYAIDPPPGLEIVDDCCWDAWYAKMEQIAGSEAYLPEGDYYAWEEGQPRTLQAVVKRLLDSCEK